MDKQATLNLSIQEKYAQILPIKNTVVFKLLNELPLEDNLRLLEIGPADTNHLAYILQHTENTAYFGNYDAQTAENKIFSNYEGDSRIQFRESTAEKLDFQDAFFDCCFMVNQIYFWAEPLAYFKEIHRVLKPEGKMKLAFFEKKFAGHLPWTLHDFTLYETEEVKSFFKQSGFLNVTMKKFNETAMDQDGSGTCRPFVMISGQKF